MKKLGAIEWGRHDLSPQQRHCPSPYRNLGFLFLRSLHTTAFERLKLADFVGDGEIESGILSGSSNTSQMLVSSRKGKVCGIPIPAMPRPTTLILEAIQR